MQDGAYPHLVQASMGKRSNGTFLREPTNSNDPGGLERRDRGDEIVIAQRF